MWAISVGGGDRYSILRCCPRVRDLGGRPVRVWAAVLADNAGIGDGNLIYAREVEHNDGPWVKGDDERKLDGVLRYTGGDASDGWTLTAMAYHNIWISPTKCRPRHR